MDDQMTDFTPVLYLKAGCPHCFRVLVFLCDSGQIGRFTLRTFTPGDAEEASIRAKLTPHFAKVTFPTVQYASGLFQNESGDIITRYSEGLPTDRTLPVFRAWVEGIQPKLAATRAENRLLRAALAEAGVPLPHSVSEG
jgi:hypothetical protein